MWIIFAARILNPASSMRVMILPTTFFRTASGLMMASVRWLMRSSSGSDDVRDRRAHVGGALHERRTRGLERLHLLGSRSLAAGDDGAGVAHAAPGRRCLATDERDDRLSHVCLDVRGGLLL